MTNNNFFFHSPLTIHTAATAAHRCLLLQFMINEIIQTPSIERELTSPFRWPIKTNSIDKLKEHSELLSFAFPFLQLEAKKFAENLDKKSSHLISLLEPFIRACQTDENLIFFLLKHQNHSDINILLDKIYTDRSGLKSFLVHQYKKRGFNHLSKIINEKF